MNAFEFSDRTLEDLERVQGGGAGRGKIDRKGIRAVAKGFAKLSAFPAKMGSSIGLGIIQGSKSQRSANALSNAARVASRAPQVMVKVTSRLRGAPSTLGAMTYVTRLGMSDKEPLELETSEGEILTRADEMMKLAREWQQHEMSDEARRQGATAISIVFSMPPGTDPEKVREAVREFAETDMSNRRWAMALHTDEPHPHVHLIMANRDEDGRRINPDRAFLQHCRERFAENLRALGVEADATKRITRGYPLKRDQLPIHKMRERGATPDVDKGRAATVKAEAPDAKERLSERVKQRSKTAENVEVVKGVYQRAIDELEAHGGADEVARAKTLRLFVTSMPEPLDAKTEIIERLKAGNALPDHFEKDPELEKLKARVESRREGNEKSARERMKEAGEGVKARTASLRKQTTQANSSAQNEARQAQLDRIRERTARLKQSASVDPAGAHLASKIEKLPERLKELQREKDRARDRQRDRDNGVSSG